MVEVMVASVIGTFVALVAVGTLRAVSVNAEMVDNNINTAAEVRFASRRIAADLLNRHLGNTKLVGTIEESPNAIKNAWRPEESGQEAISCLTFYTVGRGPARVDQPEGDVYEVEYYLAKDGDKGLLMRRLRPNPDEYFEAEGVLSVIAENIDVFEVRFFDGEEWYSEWMAEEQEEAGQQGQAEQQSGEMEPLPELVEITIAAKQTGREDVISESFVVYFAESIEEQADVSEGSEPEQSDSASETDEGEEQTERPSSETGTSDTGSGSGDRDQRDQRDSGR